ncbi:bifunctional LLM class flavin-dependent oxidoreductase/SDR family oxidoreductase [Streptomyces sp. JJ38]|uniref:bifunctional LLM class flavin-dependent oxidoreductase/SDR family oxidoreductase n=1 Tax=Streptomyces sp. JJ38 TaxID=2738128 RepID=UPI001C573569|nr:bifunctional LLM class flavin-dependent oxidoreductase/SDR family oxidoreductase [Streptomyces sp. JJ38]MBW1598461.1 LLM class flavin-dependent oxidoreductase [Streptomyces sp. JJ38]
MKFSLMFFASDENSLSGSERYDLLVRSARYGDEHDFLNIWVPERHFTRLGSLYPNPAVLHAALARETSRIGLRAGSVVLPLHNPLRVAEEWAVVDNLSGGRAGLSLATGWNPDDFALFPDRYSERAAHLDEALPTLRALWRGEPTSATSGTGAPIRIRSYPRPVQPELPLWLTAASSPASFAKAGSVGANLLTHLLDQGVDGLAENIARYRKARADAGFDPAEGQVTVMLHSFVGEDHEATVELARDPYCRYLKGNMGLLKGLARSRGRDADTDVDALPEEELSEFVGFLYDRFAASRSLIGSPGTCLPLVRRLAAVGVDEVACLLDFGPPADQVLDGLPQLNRLRELAEADPEVRDPGTADRSPQAAFPVPSVEPGPRWADDPEVIRARCATEVDAGKFFTDVEAAGAAYGPRMRCLETLWVGEDEVLGRLRLPPGGEGDGYEFHPALLDNAFLLLGVLAPGALDGTGALNLPVGVGTLEVHRKPEGTVYSHVVRTRAAEATDELVADVRVFDEAGVLVRAHGLRMRVVDDASGSGDPGAELCYRTDWTEVAAPEADPAAGPGRWLVFADAAGAGEALAAELTAAGHRTELVHAEGEPDPVRVRRALYRAVAAERLSGVAMFWPMDAPDDADAATEDVTAAQRGCGEAALALIRSCLELDDPTRAGRLWFLTRGAQPAAGSPVTASGVHQAPVWGMGRVLAAEQPEVWGGVIDYAPAGTGTEPSDGGGAPDGGAAVLVAAALVSGGEAGADAGDRGAFEDQLAVRGGRLFGPRLVRDERLARPADPSPRLDPAGTYLVTGGLGDLGLALARHLVRRGARFLALTGRSGVRTEEQRAAVEELTALGARVHVARADIASAAEVAALRDGLTEAGLPPVAGVLHLAGVVSGAMLADLETERLREVAAPKIAGSWNLHRVFDDARMFLMVSALPAVFGPVGVGAANYAAANAFVDALAHHRRASGRAGVGLGYGPWNEIGLAVREDGLDQLSRMGVGSMSPAEGLTVLDRVLHVDPQQVTVARLAWPDVFGAVPTARVTRQFAGFLDESGDTGSPELLRRYAEAGPAARAALVGDYLTERLAAVLRGDAADIDRQQPVNEMGMDSLMSLDLRNRVKADLGVVVPMVRLLQGTSVEELTAFVLELLAGAVDATDEAEEREEFTL